MLTAKSPDRGRDLMSLLKGLDREEILHVLSQGICHHCQPLLHRRVVSLLNKKLNDSCLLNDSDSSECVNKTPRLHEKTSPTQESIQRKGYASIASDSEVLLNDGDQKEEHIQFSQPGRKEFTHIERIDGRLKNVVQGLELHTNVFNAEEQNTIVQHVYSLQRMGQKGLLRERTYSEPRKWMRGKGRVTIQFGCCYNYAVDKKGNPPGIIRDEVVDPLPPLFKQMIKRMVRWHILPPTCVPDSCIVNIYDEGDCIPPHIDHHDFLRPFCTVSFLTECSILFGLNLKVLSPGEFAGPVSIPLPVGSVLILSGNGADIAKHCVPAVPARRISITFRKMDDSKLPYEFSPDPELMGIKPMVYSPLNKSPMEQNGHHKPHAYPPLANSSSASSKKTNGNTFMVENDDFPPLGSSSKSGNQLRFTRRG